MKWQSIKTKALSVNEAWKGRRFKTNKYKSFEKLLLYCLPSLTFPDPPFQISIKFGFSSKASDVDNGAKPFIDVLQKKYGFNDRDIYRLILEKEIVPKGAEFIDFKVEKYFQQKV